MKPGDWVRTVELLVGTAQGPSAEHGDGALREVHVGSRCEVFDVERDDRLAHRPLRPRGLRPARAVSRGSNRRATSDRAGYPAAAA